MRPCLEPAIVDLLTWTPPNPTLQTGLLGRLDDRKAATPLIASESGTIMARNIEVAMLS